MAASVFQHSAIVSGLLTQQDLDEAVAAVRAGRKKPHSEVSDERLAEKLVSMGRLNRWQAEQLRAGRTKFNLGPYRVVDSIGQGGMGQVFKAEHTVMGRIVAVKVLPRSRSTPEAVLNFQREIRAQAQLDHENLVRAYDAGQDGNVHFLVTEYIDGNDLRRLVRHHGQLSMTAAATIVSQAAKGLEHAHQRGLIHRDVKPANILVTRDGRTKVSDLGLADFFSESEQTDLMGAKVVGTADYLAPELIMHPGRLAPTADIYSLGCTLYYAVTGKVPFPGGTARDKAWAHCHQLPLDPRRLNPDLSDDFVEVIAEMMAKEPGHRIATAGLVADRLRPWVTGVLPAAAQPAPPPPAPTPLPVPPLLTGVAPSVMADTEPFFLVEPHREPHHETSSSQLSFGTHPVSSAQDSTAPAFRDTGGSLTLSRLRPDLFGPSRRVRWLIQIGAMIIVAAITTVVVQLLAQLLNP